MCVQCVLQVSRAFTFKQQCQRSDATLRLYCRNSYEEIIVSEDEDNKSIANNLPVEVQFQNMNDDSGKCVLLVEHIKTDGNVLVTGSGGDLDSNRSTIQVSHEIPQKLLTGQDDHMDLIGITQNDELITSEERTTVKIDEEYSEYRQKSIFLRYLNIYLLQLLSQIIRATRTMTMIVIIVISSLLWLIITVK